MADKVINDVLNINAGPKYVINNTLPFTATIENQKYLQFKSVQASILSFISAQRIEDNYKSLKFKSIYATIIDNDLTSLNFYWNTPSLTNVESTVPVLSYLYSISIDYNNTGYTDNTQIGLYINNILYETFTITPTADSYSYIKRFLDKEVVTTGDIVSFRVLDTSVDCYGLNINLFFKSFDAEIKAIGIFSRFGSKDVKAIDNITVFNSADKWVVTFNQPIKSIESIEIFNDVDLLDTPSYTLDKDKIILDVSKLATNLVISLITYDNNIVNIPINILNQEGIAQITYYLSGAYADTHSNLIINTTSLRYKLNSDQFSSWTRTEDYSFKFDFSTSINGVNTITIEYVTNLGIVSETLNYEYRTSTLECNIEFSGSVATIYYTDESPIYRLVYSLNGIQKREEYPYVISGFNEFSKNISERKVTMGAGELYHKGHKYIYSPEEYTITDNVIAKRYILFVFDKTNLEFKYISLSASGGDEPLGLASLNYVLIRQIGVKYDQSLQEPNPTTIIYYNEKSLFSNHTIDIDYTEIGYHAVTVQDITGRTKTETFGMLSKKVNQIRQVTAIDESSDTVVSGQIHFSDTLIFTISEV